MKQKLIFEALFVGLLLLLVVKVMQLVQMLEGNHDLQVLAAGVMVHFICEALGFNKWYCVNGNACS